MATTWAEIESWLKQHDFVEARAGGHGHVHYTHPPTGVKVTLIAPGRARGQHKEPLRRELASLIRSLERCGYARADVRRDLGAL
jgi:hypothetical protein